jgi:hypothetical protein
MRVGAVDEGGSNLRQVGSASLSANRQLSEVDEEGDAEVEKKMQLRPASSDVADVDSSKTLRGRG